MMHMHIYGVSAYAYTHIYTQGTGGPVPPHKGGEEPEMDAGVTTHWQPLGIPSAIPPLGQLHLSVLGDMSQSVPVTSEMLEHMFEHVNW